MSRLSLSPSKIRSYERCPLQYKLQGEPRPQGAEPAPLSPELAVDRALHEALDRFAAELLRGEGLSAERLCELLREEWPQSAFATPEEAQGSLALWQERVPRFLAVHAASSAALVAGKSFVSTNLAGARVTAVLDRVDRLPGGGLELVDYKSGKPPRHDFDLARDLASALAFAAAGADRKLLKLGQPLRFTQWYLQNQQRVSHVFGPNELAWAGDVAARAAEGIGAGEFPARRGPQCSYCDQLDRCPAWPKTPRALAGEDEETFSRRLRASYSKLALYKSCPRAYAKVYVEKLPTCEKPFFDLGKAVHETLEAFHAAEWQGGDGLDALLARFEQSFARHQAGYRGEEEKARYQARGRAMLEAYHRRFVAPQGRKLAFRIEEYFELPLGKHVVLNGFMDRIDRDEQGRLSVWDYKTESTERAQQEVDEDLQLGLYAWACHRLFGQEVELGLYMLAHDRVQTTRRSAEQLAEIERQVDELARQILDETRFEPKLNRHCPDCDWLHDCPLRPQVEAGLREGSLRPAGFAEG
jgi:RecB family exonuclease